MAISKSNSKTVYAPASSTYPYTISISFTETEVDKADNSSKINVIGQLYGKNINFTGCECTLAIYWYDDNKYTDGRHISTTTFTSTTKGTAEKLNLTISVDHKDDGTLSGYAKVIFTKNGTNSYAPPTTTVTTASASLTSIARASALGTISDFTIGEVIEPSITKYVSTYDDLLQIYLNDELIKTISGINDGDEVNFNTSELNYIYTLMSSTQTATFTFKLTTMNGSTTIGTSTKTAIGTINTSEIKPSVPTYTTEEVGNVPTDWGLFVKNKSKIKFTISTTPSTGSTITEIKTTLDGVTYTGAEFETDYIKTAGELNLIMRATDSRKITNGEIYKINVVDYDLPYITSASAIRSDENGNESDSGTYLKVDLDAGVYSIEGNNTATYQVLYKKTTATEFTTYTINSTELTYNGSVKISELDTNSSYDVKIVVKDYFSESTKNLPTVTTAFVTVDYLEGGHGMAVGKVAEEEDTFEVAFQTKLTGGLKPIILEEDTDLDEVTIPNFYSSGDVASYGYLNCPITSGTFDLRVFSGGSTGQIGQELTSCNKTNPVTYIRYYYSGEWGEWTSTIGNLSNLQTTDKSSIIGAVNEMVQNISDISQNMNDIYSYSFANNGYIRFKNGFQIAWIYSNVTAGGTAWGNVYYSDHSMGNWSVAFTALYFAKATTNATTFWCTEAGYSTTSGGTVRCFRPNNGTGSIGLRIVGIGKWK